MENLVQNEGERNSTVPSTPAIRLGVQTRDVDDVAREACSGKDAFHLVFIHADTGGRALQGGIERRSRVYCEAMQKICAWPTKRCIILAPRHETEAWVLADPTAVTGTLGYNGRFDLIGLPSDANQAERLEDPKATLSEAIRIVRGRRTGIDVEQIFPAIAQRQSMEALRRSRSFAAFEQAIRIALQDLGCVRRSEL